MNWELNRKLDEKREEEREPRLPLMERSNQNDVRLVLFDHGENLVKNRERRVGVPPEISPILGKRIHRESSRIRNWREEERKSVAEACSKQIYIGRAPQLKEAVHCLLVESPFRGNELVGAR